MASDTAEVLRKSMSAMLTNVTDFDRPRRNPRYSDLRTSMMDELSTVLCRDRSAKIWVLDDPAWFCSGCDGEQLGRRLEARKIGLPLLPVLAVIIALSVLHAR